MFSSITSETLTQLRYIIEQMSKEEYALKLPILNNASIGQHVRHVLEFYSCLSLALASGKVDYDKRERNLNLEHDPDAATGMIDKLCNMFGQANLNDFPLVNQIELKGITIQTDSSLGREMVYLIEHSIHHFAIINIALKNCFEHIITPENFGLAHSTVKHYQTVSSEHIE